MKNWLKISIYSIFTLAFTPLACPSPNNKLLRCIGEKIEHSLTSVTQKLPCTPLITLTQDNFTSNGTYTITSPGQYCIASDITGTISVENTTQVELFLEDHLLTIPSPGQAAITITHCSDVHICQGVIQKNPNASSPVGIGISITSQSKNIVIEDVHTIGCATGIDSVDSNHIRIADCLCESGLIGISCQAQSAPCYDHVISQTTLLNNSNTGISCGGNAHTVLNSVIVKSCTILNTALQPNASTYGIKADQTQGLTIKNTTINTATDLIAVKNTCDVSIASCKLLNAAHDGVSITNSANGDSQSTALQACSLDNVLIDQSGYRNIECTGKISLTCSHCQLLQAQDSALSLVAVMLATIEHCTISNAFGSVAPIVVIGDGSAVPCDTIRINHCTIENWLAGQNVSGIYITNTDTITIAHSTISPANATTGSGIYLTGSNGNCIVHNCVIAGNPGTGIAVQNVANATNNQLIVDGCHITQTTTAGIALTNAQNCIIKNTDIKNSTAAVSVSNGTNITISQNFLSNCFMYGIYLDAGTSACGVRDNTICGIQNKANDDAVGIQNLGQNNAIYHNYAYNNTLDYSNVPLAVTPALGIGAHENLSSS